MTYSFFELIINNLSKLSAPELSSIRTAIDNHLPAEKEIILARVKELRDTGHKIEAIKYMRANGFTMGGLLEDKTYIESL